MKKYVITQFAATNIANLGSVSFGNNGENVLITGQNGAGKSTVKKTLLWLLGGSTSDGEKLIPNNTNCLPVAEIEIFDGKLYSKYSKMMTRKGNTISAECFVNGISVTQKEYNENLNKVVPPNIFRLMIDVFGFTALKPAEQRAILLSHFGNVTDEEVLASDGKFQELNFGGLTVENFITSEKRKARNAEDKSKFTSGSIETLEEMPSYVDDGKSAQIEERLEYLKNSLEENTAQYEELKAEIEESKKLKARLVEVQSKKQSWIKERKRLVEKYVSVNKVCPTCKQAIQAKEVMRIQNDIAKDGVAANEKIAEFQKEEEELLDTLKFHNDEFARADAVYQSREKIIAETATLKSELEQIERQKKADEDRQHTIQEKKLQVKNYGREVSEHERKIDLAGQFIRKKMDLVTDAINSNFKSVKFKMYEVRKSGEEVNTCEVTMHGVPYEKLSKGEKLRACLDILQAFQKKYGVLLPIILDDAESYSFTIDGDNQQVLFKVVENQSLSVDCGTVEVERRNAA